ncbi:iron chelate uptake ABC transporter family permease subunit [Leucobacter sp. PH1c]|uniref:FecCD family ABC transporter permease n=1 Tax=Leucobacter sp. PH1c TaxID=1397278 RepID=UPI00046A7E7D|nr:iron chelate uptake ABC transporter family permease subunit [Leucobacter sp. PH1c]
MTDLQSSARLREVASALLRRERSDRRTRVLVASALVILCGVLATWQLFLTGDAEVSAREVLPAALGSGERLATYVVQDTLFPRALTAALGGALFGLSGAISQRLFGNPLATPDVIGISSGAGAGAMIVIAGLGARGLGVQAGAMLGALLVALLVYALSWRGGVHGYRLILVGIGVGACASALITFIVTRLDEVTTQRAMRWMVGSLNGSDWNGVLVLTVALALGVVLTAAIRRPLGDLALGDELASGLGVRVSRLRFGALVLATLLAASVTSVTGPIAFIALVAGPIATRVLRLPDAPLTAALVGAGLLSATDIAAQTLPLISPVPTGAITAVFGAPILIALLVRKQNRA